MKSKSDMAKSPAKQGRRNTTQAKSQAEYLYLNTDLNQGDIAQIVGVTEKTISTWVNADGERWKIARAAKSITKQSVISAWYLQLHALNEAIGSREEGARYPSSTEADTISKLATNIDKLERKFNLGTYIQAMNELMEFLNRREPKLAQGLAAHTLEFVKEKAQSLGNG